MWVQVSGMIGANSKSPTPNSTSLLLIFPVYQPTDSPRYYKANTGLLVICVWMCAVQYPGTYFYYRWRNSCKAKKWDAMTPEEQHHYRSTTSDTGNKR